MTIQETEDYMVVDTAESFFESRFNPYSLNELEDFFEIDKADFEKFLAKFDYEYDMSSLHLYLIDEAGYIDEEMIIDILVSQEDKYFMVTDESNMVSFKIWKLKK